MATKKPDKQAKTGRKANGQFAAGVSGNPRGRPPSKKYLSESLREWLANPNDHNPERTNADELAAALGKLALAGDLAAIREICDRTEGKPRQALDVSVEEKRRAIFEKGLDMLKQTGLSDEEARRLLIPIYPEASNEWLH